jgi:hypothetical protein
MKFTEYIDESSKRELKLYGMIQSLYKNCAPFIKELRKSGENKVLWRGTNKISTTTIKQVTPRQDRAPKDMPVEIHDELDVRFKKKFGWMARSEGVFITSQRASAETYGDGYIFFPVGKYEYLYNPFISDLYSEVDSDLDIYNAFVEGENAEWEMEWENEYGENEYGTWYYLGTDTGESDTEEATIAAAEAEGIEYDEHDLENIENDLEWTPEVSLQDYLDEKKEGAKEEGVYNLEQVLKGYRSTNLGLAIKRKVEIMFKCKSYYLIEGHFKKDIIKYVLEGKPMKFNPKQKELPFVRDPNWRKKPGVKPAFIDPYSLEDWKVSGLGMKAAHQKFGKLMSKAKKGHQKPVIKNKLKKLIK